MFIQPICESWRAFPPVTEKISPDVMACVLEPSFFALAKGPGTFEGLGDAGFPFPSCYFILLVAFPLVPTLDRVPVALCNSTPWHWKYAI